MELKAEQPVELVTAAVAPASAPLGSGVGRRREAVLRAESGASGGRPIILVVGRFDAYPSGVEFTLKLQHRDLEVDLMEVPWELWRRRHGRGTELPDEFMRLGVVFDDGSSWSNFDVGFPTAYERPAGPIMISRGGGGGDSGWRMNQWLWPLPPEGPLTFVAEWPAYGIAETTAVVDAGELRRAAEHAEVIWAT